MDFRQLIYIITIAEELNITKAAERLYVSQSTLSIFLGKTERELGTQLFIREKNKLIITPHGRLYVETARKILELKKELYQKIQSNQNQLSVSIGISCQTLFKLFGSVYSRFQSTYPNVHVSVTEGRSNLILEKLYSEKIDIAIIGNADLIEHPLFHTEVIKKDELLLLLSPHHPHAGLASGDYDNPPAVDMKLFDHGKFVLSDHETCEYKLAEKLFQDYHMDVHILCELNNTQNLCDMVISNTYLSLLPSYGIPRDRGVLVCRPNKPYYRYVQLLERKGKKLPLEINILKNMLVDAYLTYYIH